MLSWRTPEPSDVRTQQIAAFLGVVATHIALDPALREGAPIEGLVPRCECLIADVEALANAAESMVNAKDLAQIIVDAAAHVFVHGFRPTERHRAVLRALSGGALVDIKAQPSGAYQVTDGQPKWCGQFSGLSVGTADPAKDCVFVEGDEGPNAASLIRIGSHPFFARVMNRATHVFFVGSGQPVDLDARTRRDQLLSLFAGFVPMTMFLRGALADRVWSNNAPRACFTVDDPLLKHRYGFMRYPQLVAAMRRRKFATSIAFIPWNHRRTRRAVAALLSTGDGVPSLCVHGCDHTDREFAADNLDMLHGKAILALERMRSHQRRSGVGFDDVMVFPQGRFSAQAITALKASGYLATVNGNVYPDESVDTVTARDLLEVAVTRFDDFPLFGRRYPRDIAEFAFDLFMGKPALAVEHHGYFRNGCDALESFVDELNALDSRLEWTNLATICGRASLMKVADDGRVHVRFFTSRFTLQNHDGQPRRYLLFRHRPVAAVPAKVTIDGRDACYELRAGDVAIPVALEAGQSAQISVSPDVTGIGAPSWKPTRAYKLGVLVRRSAGELRDNYVDPARGLSGWFSRSSNRRGAATTIGSVPPGAADAGATSAYARR